MLFAQKKKSPGPGPKIINEATRLFSGLADLDYEPGYNDHVYFQYLSSNKNDISLLGAYHPEEIYSKYIIRVAGKGLIIHPKFMGFPILTSVLIGICLFVWFWILMRGSILIP